jgi:hypothetical protein
MTPLEKTLKRALRINGRDYVVTLSPDSLKITEKGHRLGLELPWADLISGDSALAIALQASVGRLQSGSLQAISNSGSRAKSATTPRAGGPGRPSAQRPRIDPAIVSRARGRRSTTPWWAIKSNHRRRTVVIASIAYKMCVRIDSLRRPPT